MTDLTRRRLLAVAGTATTVAVAGCSDSSAEADDAEPEGTILGEITVENLDDDERTVDVLVEFDGEIEHWSTHDLEPDDGTTLERDWATDPGAFRVTARLDEGEFTQISPAAWNDPECLNLFVLVTRDGNLTTLSNTDGGPCGSGELTVDGAEGAGDEE